MNIFNYIALHNLEFDLINSMLQVHQSCLQRWVDEKQKGNALTKVACPQCNTEYIIVFPNMG